MTLVATNKLSDDTISISDISSITDIGGIYCISGLNDVKNLTKEPVKVSFNGIAMLKTYSIELDITQYRTIKLFP
jgi:hypothetical protein